jgi:very-short-patch-repair endonuclease
MTKRGARKLTDWELAERRAAREHLERVAALTMSAHGLPSPVRQYQFHPTRKFRFDFAWPDHKLALEIDGGIFTNQPSHRSASGIVADIDKHNAAILTGWRVLRAHTKMVNSGEFALLVRQALDATPSRILTGSNEGTADDD